MNQAAKVQEAKGPLVWLDMDQKALDDAYDQMVYAPNRDQVHKRNMFNSDRVRARLGAPKRLAYGTQADRAARSVSDLKAERADQRVHPRRRLADARRSRITPSWPRCIVRAGAHWIGLDFDGVEGTKGDLLPMADQVRRGVAWVYKNAKSFGGDPNRIYVSGQSSGAHLAGNVVTTDWKDYGVPADIVKGALLCSGMYELKPVRLSKRSEYVAFTDEAEEKLSSQRRLDRLNCPVIVAYGTYETPEFQRQNREFAAAVKAAGKPVTLLVARGLQSFRDRRSDRQPAEPARRSGAGADEACLTKEEGVVASEMFEGLSRRRTHCGSGGRDRRHGAGAVCAGHSRKRSAGLARHGPEGARRRLRPGGLCAEPRAASQAAAASTARSVRARLGEPKRFAYGATPIERPRHLHDQAKPNAPIKVFVHGGAWRVGLCQGVLRRRRAVRARRRALRRARLHQCRSRPAAT